jgi:2-polyprenyl-3-methyl-5-hydroxy-6-metoxy-1,4-benzoquinol methylase
VRDDDLDHRRGVASVWEAFWVKSAREQAIVDVLARRHFLTAGPRLVVSVARSVLGGISGKRILDAGCGSGLASLALAREGADVTLLDISATAVANVARRAREQGVEAKAIEGSIFELPFEPGSFDLVWNTGVLEHFTPEDKRKAIAEMLRVLGPNGVVLTLNPNAGCRFYERMHEHAMRSGAWDVGYERAFESLADSVPESARLHERSIGLLAQFHYLKYALPKPLRLPYLALHEAVQLLAGPLNRRPGSILVSVIRPAR